MLLEAYLRTLWAFLQAVRSGAVENMLHEEDARLFYLRLSVRGSWEVTTTPPDALIFPAMTDIAIPLVLPLAPIILVAHVETQWARSQPEAGMASLRQTPTRR